MITILLIIIAAACNALMDTVEYDNKFYNSIFRNLDPNWWLKTHSYLHVNFIPFTKYRLDAWHLFKSLMIVAQVLAIVSYKPIVNELVDIAFFGFIWNISFNLFYNHIYKD